MIRLAVRLLRILGGLSLVLVIAGCQTTANKYAGSGPLRLSASKTKHFQKYLDEHNRGAYAISEDGGCAVFRYCPVSSCLERDIGYFAVQSCESGCKTTCKLLARGKTVVWDGPVSGLPKEAQRPQDKNASTKTKRSNNTTARLFKVPIWEAKRCKSASATMFDRKAGPEFRDCPNCPVMVTIPAGNYWVGSTENTGEVPLHEVEFAKPFAIGKFEITFDQWDACVADGGCDTYNADDQGWGRGERPVVNINWYHAKAYADWLSKKTGGTYRLPSEAEWEYAARAGACTTFWWGDEVKPGSAVCKDCGSDWIGKKTAKVGLFPPNAFGLYDTAGNVSEWVEDCKESYDIAPADGSAAAGENCHLRVHRGGSWKRDSAQLRPEFRGYDSRSYANKYTGLRIAKTLP